MLAEDTQKYNNAIYLSLNHTLGGAFCIDGKLFRGQNQKAGEFGHMILIPGGDRCYCGKQGCADAYCAASVLTGDGKNSLEVFMEQLKQGNKEAEQKWERYLDHLAILISIFGWHTIWILYLGRCRRCTGRVYDSIGTEGIVLQWI